MSVEDPLLLQAMAAMTSGGDERIALDPATGLNRYLTAPMPVDVIAYSSSTASFPSIPAMAEVCRSMLRIAPHGAISGEAYQNALEALRHRLRNCWNLPPSTQIAFAASGTDLEYVGLATAWLCGDDGIANILIGADEVGSGCPQAASGLHFAKETPLGLHVAPGRPLREPAAARISVSYVDIRHASGMAMQSEDVLLSIAAQVDQAIARGWRPLVHILHGSKTGLIQPSLAHVDALIRRFGEKVSFIVDACQARISRSLVSSYLARGIPVLTTGSKFAGGPPFSGIAFVPARSLATSGRAMPGLETVFRRAEFPFGWPGLEALPDSGNLGLLLRLQAAVFEMEAYHRLHPADVRRAIDAFEDAVGGLARRIGARQISPSVSDDVVSHLPQPIESRTLVTLDLSAIDERRDYDFARSLYAAISRPCPDGGPLVRTGQPVRCVRLPDGRFGATLRLSLSMPQIVAFAALDRNALVQTFDDDMRAIGSRILRELQHLS